MLLYPSPSTKSRPSRNREKSSTRSSRTYAWLAKLCLVPLRTTNSLSRSVMGLGLFSLLHYHMEIKVRPQWSMRVLLIRLENISLLWLQPSWGRRMEIGLISLTIWGRSLIIMKWPSIFRTLYWAISKEHDDIIWPHII